MTVETLERVYGHQSQSGERPERYIESLRFETMPPKLAGMSEHGRAVNLDVFVEPNAGTALAGQDRREGRLAHHKR
jgi:hypothetical protein